VVLGYPSFVLVLREWKLLPPFILERLLAQNRSHFPTHHFATMARTEVRLLNNKLVDYFSDTVGLAGERNRLLPEDL
jgi:hypothetical protein